MKYEKIVKNIVNNESIKPKLFCNNNKQFHNNNIINKGDLKMTEHKELRLNKGKQEELRLNKEILTKEKRQNNNLLLEIVLLIDESKKIINKQTNICKNY